LITVVAGPAVPAEQDAPAAPQQDTAPALAGGLPGTADKSAAESAAEQRWKHGQPKKKLRIAVCSARESLRAYLSRLLESYGFDVAAAIRPNAAEIAGLDPDKFDMLLLDREGEERGRAAGGIPNAISIWRGMVLYNDSVATEASLQTGDPDFGMRLAQRATTVINL
jgi:hypothetical protein